MASEEGSAIESLVCCRLDDEVEGLGGDVVVWLLRVDHAGNGADKSENGGLHFVSLWKVVSGKRDIDCMEWVEVVGV